VTGVSHATVSLGRRVVLHDVSFTPQPGQLAAVCGPNGAGKTTLLRALAGLLPHAGAPDPRRVAYLPQEQLWQETSDSRSTAAKPSEP